VSPAGSSGHLPVLCDEVIDGLEAEAGGRFLDGTFGWGGHSRALLEAHPEVTVLALDCDPEAVERAAPLIDHFPGRLEVRHLNFRDLGTLPEGDFDGILFDFGVSSSHLDDPLRGFSFRADAPLDMRLNPQTGIPASEFLERANREDLVEAVRHFGEEPRWRRVVKAIEGARGSGQLQRTLSFAKLVEDAVGGRRPQDRIHPATRTFQGIRIAVNGELEAIEAGLPSAFARLRPGGRLAAISFHSLEDRIVKRLFRRLAGKAEHFRDALPEQLRKREAEILTRKPLVATESERAFNPRSRSAKLRILRKEHAAS
jgi:16S rRNA (cytosine1402-N4)-methyltransferase